MIDYSFKPFVCRSDLKEVELRRYPVPPDEWIPCEECGRDLPLYQFYLVFDDEPVIQYRDYWLFCSTECRARHATFRTRGVTIKVQIKPSRCPPTTCPDAGCLSGGKREG